jgi:hypothetical protein
MTTLKMCPDGGTVCSQIGGCDGFTVQCIWKIKKATNENDPVILQWYCKAKKRHVFVVPRKVANKVKNEQPNARIHIWEVQPGLLLSACALVKIK